MAITEQSRHRLRTYLEETMGEEQASAMMDHLLPVGWTDLATSAEVAELDGATKRQFAELDVATKREFAAVRGEMTHEFAAVRGEMTHEFAAVRAEMAHMQHVMDVRLDQMVTKAEMERGFRRQTWALITATAAFDGLVLAALRFV